MIANANTFVMYIRSQNKKMLVPVLLDDKFEIVNRVVYYDSESTEIAPYHINICNSKIGTYSKKETAVQVLDEIQERLLIVINNVIPVERNNLIFEMPEDNENIEYSCFNEFRKAYDNTKNNK